MTVFQKIGDSERSKNWCTSQDLLTQLESFCRAIYGDKSGIAELNQRRNLQMNGSTLLKRNNFFIYLIEICKDRLFKSDIIKEFSLSQLWSACQCSAKITSQSTSQSKTPTYVFATLRDSNTILCTSSQTLYISFLLGIAAVPREIENNTYAKVWRAKRCSMGNVRVACSVSTSVQLSRGCNSSYFSNHKRKNTLKNLSFLRTLITDEPERRLG